MRNVLLAIESSRDSGRKLLSGVAKYACLHGPWLIHWEPGGLEDISQRIRNHRADGIIMRDSEQVEEIAHLGLPVIVIEHHHCKIPQLINIVTDSKKIGRMAAEHLLDCGFRNFAFCGFDDKPWSNERRKSFCKHIEANQDGVYVYNATNQHCQTQWEREKASLVEWLQGLPKPVGLMACNDDRSQHVLQACRSADLRVPDEIAIIGVDDDELICTLSDPPLSSVSVNFERAGYEGAKVLDSLMQGEEQIPNEILIQASHIVARQSTDVTAVSDPDVASAVRFIRRNAKNKIQVNDVVRETLLSRRILEKRFRSNLGRTILEEIRRVRTNLISQMLVETNLSILEIALAFGFQGTEHIARYFQREKGMSLVAYRMHYGRK
jgi:LacI family transcriptional regulator